MGLCCMKNFTLTVIVEQKIMYHVGRAVLPVIQSVAT
jgi:hypothetical protein